MRNSAKLRLGSLSPLRVRLVLAMVTILALLIACAGISAGLTRHRNVGVVSQAEAGVIRGVVLDETGRNLANVKITARNPAARPSIFFASTDDAGNFTLSTLPAGSYSISFEIDGYRKSTVTVNLLPGEPPRVVEVKLNPVSLQGTIVDASSNRALRGVTVALRDAEGKEVSRTTTDDGGQYYFGRLGSGVYAITTTLTGYEGASTQINIPLQNSFSFPLAKASSILINDHKAQNFPVINPSSGSSASNIVQAMLQDQSGLMWFATARGVSTYDGQNFSSFDRMPELATENVESLLEDREGLIWFGTGNGAVRYNPKTGIATRELAGYNVHRIGQDDDGVLWFATNRGLARLRGNNYTTLGESSGLLSEDVRSLLCDRVRHLVWVATSRGLMTYDGGQFHSQSNLEFLEHGESTVRGITEEDSGDIWLATAKGVYRYSDGQFTPFEKGDALRKRPVNTLLRDNTGKFWFASDAGITLYDPVKNETLQLPEVTTVQALYQDHDNNLWIGTPNGASRYDLYSFVIFNNNRGLSSNDVRSIWPERGTDRLWFATARGVTIFDGVNSTQLEPLIGDDVRSVTQDVQGAFWFATARGAIRYDGAQLTVYDESRGLPSNDTRFILEDSKNGVWVATGHGAAHLSAGPDGQFEQLALLHGIDIRHISEGPSGALLFSTDRGLFRYAADSNRFIDEAAGLPSNNVYATLFDHEGTAWVATDRGVKRLRLGQFIDIPRDEALASESVRAVFQDKSGYLWFGTADGKLKKYLQLDSSAVVQVYGGERLGLPAAVPRAITQAADGRVWVATDAGAIRHTPHQLAPPTRVHAFVNGRETSQTSLRSGNYNLAFNFQGASSSGDVQYSYQLIGYDRERRLLGPGDEHRVSYNDLPPGLFTFEVRSFNRDLYGPAAVDIPIEIAEPFYHKGWFYALSCLTFLGLGAGVVTIKRQQERGPALPPHLKQFVRIEPNPFIVGNPIRHERMFYGREDDFKYVQTKLDRVSQGVVIVFCGERRTGKSSILYQILNQRLGPRFLPVFIDMQEMVISNDRGFFARVARAITQVVAGEAPQQSVGAQAGVRTDAHPGSPLRERLDRFNFNSPEVEPYDLFTAFIDEALLIIGGRTLLLLVDEYELLEGKVSEGKVSEEIFTYLAALMEKHERLAFIFTGSRRLEERDRRYWGMMLSRAIYRKVSYLSENDTRRLITEPVQDRVVYHHNVVDSIVRLTSGQPFYTQVICQNLVDYLNEHGKNLLLSSDLKQVIDEILDHPLPQMIYFWESLNDDEKVSLSLLAESLGDTSSYASTRDIMRLIRRNNYPVNLSEDTIHLTLEDLFRREALLKSTDDRYRLRVGLFRVWIRRSHSIWQVVKEVKTL